METKSFVVSTVIFISFLLVIGGIGFYSWEYFKKGINRETAILNTPTKVEESTTTKPGAENNVDSTGISQNLTNKDSSGIAANTQTNRVEKESSGISNDPAKPVVPTKPQAIKPNTNIVIDQNDEDDRVLGTQTTQKATFSMPKPDVSIDDNTVEFDYTFTLNDAAAEKLRNGMSYEIKEDSCDTYFDDEVLNGSFDRGEIGRGMGITFQLPEEYLDNDTEDDDYLVRTSYSIYDNNDKLVFTGTTWAPNCD